MPKRNLTDNFIKSAKAPAAGRLEIFDAKVPGMALRLTSPSRKNPKGVKTWNLVYRLPRKSTVQRLALGRYPDMSLSDARQAAWEARKLISDGEDPAAERRESRSAATFSEIADRYIEEYAKPRKRSWQRDRWVIERFFKPKLGSTRAASVTFDECAKIIDALRVKTPGQANRVHEILRKIFYWAASKKLIPPEKQNPAKGIERAKETSRDRVLSEAELAEVWRATEVEAAKHRAMYRLRMLTLARGGEISLMRGNDLADELRGPSWTVRAETTKAGRALWLPLSRQAVAELLTYTGKKSIAEIVRDVPGPLFATGRDNPQKRSFKVTSRLIKRSGVDFVPHDLRRTGATLLAALSVPRLVVSMLLGHAEGGITGRVYDRFDRAEERRAALQTYADHIDAVLGRTAKQGDVISMAAAAV